MITEPSRLPTILLVEDHADSLAVMEKMVRRCGFVVFTACDCESARAVTKKNTVDLLICDIGLPDGDGLELTKQLIAEHKAAKSIIVSGYCMPNEVKKIEASGCDFHFAKPFDFDRLLEAIEMLMQSAKPVNEANEMGPTTAV